MLERLEPTISAQLRARVESDPDRDLVTCGGTDWRTVGESLERASALAAGLHEVGVRHGDRVASIMPNRAEVIDLFLACAALGAITVPLNVFLKGEFLRYQLADAEPSVVIADQAGLEQVLALSGQSPVAEGRIVAVDPTDEDITGFGDLFLDPIQRWAEPGPDDLLAILYTSGTTGMPKGCMISNGYAMHWPRAHYENGWFTPEDTSLCPLPLYHGFGLSGFIDGLAGGCRLSFEPAFSASTLLDRAREIEATQVYAVGAMGAAMLATPPSDRDREHGVERMVFVPMAPEGQREFEKRFGTRVMCEGYGQTEVIPATMGVTASEDRDGPTAGKALDWLEVRVVDDEDNALPAGESGEIVVRPREPHAIFSGYWRKGDETVEAWRNLWHHTGDLGRFSEDGTLYFVDRKKDAIRRRGENVSSVELELALSAHPDIAQAAVHATPSELGEDDIKACLVLEPEAELALETLFEFMRDQLPYYAIPRYVEFIKELPVNAMGRVQKHKLRSEWETPATIDLHPRGLVVDRAARR